MATKRKFIPDPQGAVEFQAANGVVSVPAVSNDSTESNLDNYAGPWGLNTFMEQFGNGRATLGLNPEPATRQLVGKMKSGC